jgi:hypothetical protein
MKRKIFMLAIAMAFGSVMLSGCDRTEKKAAKADANKQVESPSPAPGSTSAPVALGQPSTEAEKKAGIPPVQGEVDTREQAQRKEFEQKK